MSETSRNEPDPYVWNKQEVTYEAYCSARRDAKRKRITVIMVCVLLLVGLIVLPLDVGFLDIVLIAGSGTILSYFGAAAVFPNSGNWGKPLFKKAESHFGIYERQVKK